MSRGRDITPCFLGSMWFTRHALVEVSDLGASLASATFRLSAIQDEAHLLADPGLLLIAIGLRRNAFAAHTSVDSFLMGREIHVKWKPELMDQPFFVAASPKGTGLRLDAPMKYSAMTQFLKKHCALAGMGGVFTSHIPIIVPF